MRIFIIMSLLSFLSHADGLDLKYGLGVALPDNSIAVVKYFGLAYHNDFAISPLRQKIELGVWADSNSSRSSSALGSYSIGLRVEPSIFYLESYWGVGIVTGLDRRLSSHFQFVQDLSLGLQDDRGRFMGVTWKHVSNAGITQPNQGRDFMLIQIGSKFK